MEGPREVRLRPEWAAYYDNIAPGEWMPVQVMLDRVTAQRLLRGRRSGEVLGQRILDDRHFEFRGGYRRPIRPGPRFPERPID